MTDATLTFIGFGVGLVAMAISFWSYRLSRRASVDVVYEITGPPNAHDAAASVLARTLAGAVGASRVKLLSVKRGRLVVRLESSSFGPCVAKIGDASRPDALLGVHSEAAILTYLTTRRYKHAPTVKGVEFLAPSSIVLFREDLHGETIHQRMRRMVLEGEWPTHHDVLKAAEAVGRIVADLHDLGVVHGDIKPANVIFNFRGSNEFRSEDLPWLIDFESSQFARLGGDDLFASRSGTWGFIAPERYFVNSAIKQSDVFSLSALTWFLFVGRVGLYGSSARDRIPEPIRRFLRESLDIDPLGRPADARAWLMRLEEARAKLDVNTLKQRVQWPKNWVHQNDELLSQTLGRALATSSQNSETILEATESVNRNAMRAVRTQVSAADINLFKVFLDSNLRLEDYAKREGVARQKLRSELESVYDGVSRAIAGGSSGAIAGGGH